MIEQRKRGLFQRKISLKMEGKYVKGDMPAVCQMFLRSIFFGFSYFLFCSKQKFCRSLVPQRSLLGMSQLTLFSTFLYLNFLCDTFFCSLSPLGGKRAHQLWDQEDKEKSVQLCYKLSHAENEKKTCVFCQYSYLRRSSKTISRSRFFSHSWPEKSFFLFAQIFS